MAAQPDFLINFILRQVLRRIELLLERGLIVQLQNDFALFFSP